MKRAFLLCAALIVFGSQMLFGQAQPDSLLHLRLNEVVVSATRAGDNTPMAFSNINSASIKGNNAARNLPLLLQTTPSLVAFTEDGSGVGNVSMRIRGTDATRINVTLNGMPLNNPESQEVYWVNLPDLSNSLQSIQVQRGIGTSTNGSAAFGASISMRSAGARTKAYGEASSSVGSYNTFLSTISAGTGILENGLSLDARYSRVTGEGYIRNGGVDHRNLYVSMSHSRGGQLLQLVYMNGIQHTGITWEGVTKEQMDDPEFGRRYNPAGEYYDDAGNRLYYGNETDNYYSHIAQLIFSRELNEYLLLNASASYNNGFGYYENWKSGQNLKSKFGFEPQVVDGVTYTSSDVVRRKLMANDFYVGNISLRYNRDALTLHSGAMLSLYDGDHYGTLPWVKYNENISPSDRWYENNGFKREASVFAKANYDVSDALSVYADLQGRLIGYDFSGVDDDFVELDASYRYRFVNPKAGVFYSSDRFNSFYASVAMANREPLRTDLKDSKKLGATSEIKPERMIDYEVGYRYSRGGVNLGANLYYMDYNNQMVQTGRLNDVGYKLMENVKDSYRAGVELEAGVPLVGSALRFDANVTLSRNRISNYTAYMDVNDDNWDVVGQVADEMGDTNISYSPSVTGAGLLTWQASRKANVRFIGKYVSRQYLDNTSNREKSLDPYFVGDLAMSYTFGSLLGGNATLDLFVNNLFNARYSANGYASSYVAQGSENQPYHYVGYYPQATRNFMARMTIKF